jgi:hypothetical protein
MEIKNPAADTKRETLHRSMKTMALEKNNQSLKMNNVENN